jgi:hypothetical protein
MGYSGCYAAREAFNFKGDFGKWIPFCKVGIANTISDTHFFNRPFTSLDTVDHFEVYGD